MMSIATLGSNAGSSLALSAYRFSLDVDVARTGAAQRVPVERQAPPADDAAPAPRQGEGVFGQLRSAVMQALDAMFPAHSATSGSTTSATPSTTSADATSGPVATTNGADKTSTKDANTRLADALGAPFGDALKSFMASLFDALRDVAFGSGGAQQSVGSGSTAAATDLGGAQALHAHLQIDIVAVGVGPAVPAARLAPAASAPATSAAGTTAAVPAPAAPASTNTSSSTSTATGVAPAPRTASNAGADGDADDGRVRRGHRHGHHHGGYDSFVTRLQRLLGRLDAAGASADGSEQGKRGDALSRLQQRFDDLVKASGQSDGKQPTLRDFLQKLLDKVGGAAQPSGAATLPPSQKTIEPVTLPTTAAADEVNPTDPPAIRPAAPGVAPTAATRESAAPTVAESASSTAAANISAFSFALHASGMFVNVLA